MSKIYTIQPQQIKISKNKSSLPNKSIELVELENKLHQYVAGIDISDFNKFDDLEITNMDKFTILQKRAASAKETAPFIWIVLLYF